MSIFRKLFNLLDVDKGKQVPTSINILTFDWDGTLLDSREATLKAYQVVFEEAGIPICFEEVLKNYSPNWYKTYQALRLPEKLYSWADQRWLEVFRQEPRKLVSGAQETLEVLSSKGYGLVLLTAAARERLVEELQIFGLEHFFQKVVCMEDFKARKPDPAPLLFTIGQLHSEPENFAYLGDSVEDIEMGKKAGVFTIAVEGPYVPREALVRANPSILISNLKELLKIL